MVYVFNMKLQREHDEGDQEDVIFSYKKPMELFSDKKMVKICAPMVRYSK